MNEITTDSRNDGLNDGSAALANPAAKSKQDACAYGDTKCGATGLKYHCDAAGNWSNTGTRCDTPGTTQKNNSEIDDLFGKSLDQTEQQLTNDNQQLESNMSQAQQNAMQSAAYGSGNGLGMIVGNIIGSSIGLKTGNEQLGTTVANILAGQDPSAADYLEIINAQKAVAGYPDASMQLTNTLVAQQYCKAGVWSGPACQKYGASAKNTSSAMPNLPSPPGSHHTYQNNAAASPPAHSGGAGSASTKCITMVSGPTMCIPPKQFVNFNHNGSCGWVCQ